jgi:hypothetical protein
MTFDLDAPAAARREAARERAGSAGVADAARRLDAGHGLDDDVRAALGAALPGRPEDAFLDWVVALEELAVVSPALALVAAADALRLSALADGTQWPGCRGVNLDGLRATASDVWHGAVSAVLVGGARGAVEAAVASLRAAPPASRSSLAAQPHVADAATAVDASRLLLWDAVLQGARPTAATARHLARVHALASVGTALRALPQAVDPDALRRGAPLDRLRRDLDTLAIVLSDERASRDAAAAALVAGGG